MILLAYTSVDSPFCLNCYKLLICHKISHFKCLSQHVLCYVCVYFILAIHFQVKPSHCLPSKYRGIKLTRLGIFAALQSISLSQSMQPFPLNGFRLLINCILFSISYQSNTEIACVLISFVLFKLHFNRMPAQKNKSFCSCFFALFIVPTTNSFVYAKSDNISIFFLLLLSVSNAMHFSLQNFKRKSLII